MIETWNNGFIPSRLECNHFKVCLEKFDEWLDDVMFWQVRGRGQTSLSKMFD